MLNDDLTIVDRSSIILLRNKLFDYPSKSLNAVFGLGPATALTIIFNYIKIRPLHNNRDILNFKDWVISQFGETLYRIFFKPYAEKVWGIPCDRISSEWGAQRIKGLSLRTAIIDALWWDKKSNDAASLVKQFDNLQLVGRYGTYAYNNIDHLRETGILGAKNILGGNES